MTTHGPFELQAYAAGVMGTHVHNMLLAQAIDGKNEPEPGGEPPAVSLIMTLGDETFKHYVVIAQCIIGPQERYCRVCGCTENDCEGCVHRTGNPCHWVEDDLCSACVGVVNAGAEVEVPA